MAKSKDNIERTRYQTRLDPNAIRILNIISAMHNLSGANYAIEKLVKEYCVREGIKYEMED